MKPFYLQEGKVPTNFNDGDIYTIVRGTFQSMGRGRRPHICGITLNQTKGIVYVNDMPMGKFTKKYVINRMKNPVDVHSITSFLVKNARKLYGDQREIPLNTEFNGIFNPYILYYIKVKSLPWFLFYDNREDSVKIMACKRDNVLLFHRYFHDISTGKEKIMTVSDYMRLQLL